MESELVPPAITYGTLQVCSCLQSQMNCLMACSFLLPYWSTLPVFVHVLNKTLNSAKNTFVTWKVEQLLRIISTFKDLY